MTEHGQARVHAKEVHLFPINQTNPKRFTPPQKGPPPKSTFSQLRPPFEGLATEPLRGHRWKKCMLFRSLEIISFERNMLFRSLEIISFERNMLFRSLEISFAILDPLGLGRNYFVPSKSFRLNEICYFVPSKCIIIIIIIIKIIIINILRLEDTGSGMRDYLRFQLF